MGPITGAGRWASGSRGSVIRWPGQMTNSTDLYRVRSLSECIRDVESHLDADLFTAPVLLHMMTQAEYWAKQSVRTMQVAAPQPSNSEQTDRWNNPALLVLTVSPQLGSLTPAEITVGRSARADVCLPYPKISKLHGHFRVDDGVYSLVDGNSTNGTYVDGVRIPSDAPYPLPADCIVFFGKYETRFMMPEAFRRHLHGLLKPASAG